MTAIIITICVLLILAYVFDITSSKTKIPSVILLLLLGWFVNQLTTFLNFSIPDLNSVLPLLGTLGLILIVLDGSMELEINKEKFPIIWKSSLIALLPMLGFSFGMAYILFYLGFSSIQIGLVNSIPFAVISSAIAIPSAKYLSSKNKEFVTYESSFSDIYGVIFFNFFVIGNQLGFPSFQNFFIDLTIIIVVSFIATLALSFFINRIRHHVKFAPIIILITLIYFISHIYHLPALIFILFFGLFLNNIDELRNFKFVEQFHPINFSKEVLKFKELTAEISFLVRSLFFLLFGFLIETTELLNTDTMLLALIISFGIFLLRSISLKIFRLPKNPLLFLAPRGLITILLFLSIPPEAYLSFINKSLVIQVIIFSTLFMMFGLMFHKKDKSENIINKNISAQ